MVFVFIRVADKERQSGQLCPPMTYKEKYEVVFIENGIQMYGCASLDHNPKVSDVPVLHFWFEAPINSSFEPTYCKNIDNSDSTYNESYLRKL